MHQVNRFLPARPDAFILMKGRLHCKICSIGRDWIYLGKWQSGQEIEPLWYDHFGKLGWSCTCEVRFPPKTLIPKDCDKWQYADDIPII